MELARSEYKLVTFLSDFGWSGGYVAACEAVILSLAPDARVVHIGHELTLGAIRSGSLVLSRVAPLYPKLPAVPTVHLAVVDPGVGTVRQPLIIVAERGDVLVGPDNGLLLPAAKALGGIRDAWQIIPGKVRALAAFANPEPAPTFHGRDVFAPAAALIASGVPITDIAEPLDQATLVQMGDPVCEITYHGVLAEVIEIDRFGNVGLAACFSDDLLPVQPLTVEVEGESLPAWDARVVKTYADLASGELGVYKDSWGQVGLAVNAASAAELLSVDLGMLVRITKRFPE